MFGDKNDIVVFLIIALKMRQSSYKVAVIGGGRAGLLTARELQREGQHVTLFEKASRVGGTWLYNSQVETDLLGFDPNREIVHSSLYKSLRVNLPRQIMGFMDYPFVKKEDGDPRPFPGHEEVLRFLEDFAKDSGLMELIRFEHEVVRVELVDEVSHEWVVESRTRGTESNSWDMKEEVFEAVVVCTGQFTQPRTAEFSGRDTWPGLQMHSHNYRSPEQFENKVVVVIGNGPSAREILKEISSLARQVHHAIRGHGSMIECACKDGKVVFQDGSIVDADVIVHCTGFKYNFPFLRTNGIITVDDNRVGPLYKHVFPPSLAPWLSFVGLTFMTVSGMVTELQAKWVAKVLSGKVKLPTQEAMANSVEEFYRQMETSGCPKHHTHNIKKDEFDYKGWIAAQLDTDLPRIWKEVTLLSIMNMRFSYGDNYRETWDVDKWIQEMYSSSN